MKLLCKINIHRWEIGCHVTTGVEDWFDEPKQRVATYNYHRECQWCGKMQLLVKPKKYHPSKYVWINQG